MIDINLIVVMIGALIYFRIVMTDEDVLEIAGTVATFLTNVLSKKKDEEALMSLQDAMEIAFARKKKLADFDAISGDTKKQLEHIGITNVSVGTDGIRGSIAGLAQILSATESLDEPTEAPMDSKGNIKRKIAPLESGQKTVTEAMAVAKESKRV